MPSTRFNIRNTVCKSLITFILLGGEFNLKISSDVFNPSQIFVVFNGTNLSNSASIVDLFCSEQGQSVNRVSATPVYVTIEILS